jgi:hypothetical protein
MFCEFLDDDWRDCCQDRSSVLTQTSVSSKFPSNEGKNHATVRAAQEKEWHDLWLVEDKDDPMPQREFHGNDGVKTGTPLIGADKPL